MDKKDSSLEILQMVGEFIDNDQNFALATVLKAEGSTPRKAGVHAIILDTGKIWGTLGGGVVEVETQRKAIESCKSNKPVVFDIELHGADRDDDVPICGGSMRILVDPTANQYASLFIQVAEAIRSRTKGILLSNINTTTDLKTDYQWLPEDSIQPDIGFPGYEKIRSCIKNEMPLLLQDNLQEPTASNEIFIEPLIPGPLLIIAGGGHVGQALALQASLVGFDIIVIDDRPEFTDSKLFPESVQSRCGDIAGLLTEIPGEKDTYIVIVTRGHKDDAKVLEACIQKPFAYIGMIGSRRKVALIREHFIQSGLSSNEEFDKIFSPVGMDIGAVTVPEIAASITAELIAVRRKGIIHTPLNKVELQ